MRLTIDLFNQAQDARLSADSIGHFRFHVHNVLYGINMYKNDESMCVCDVWY